MLRLSYLQGDGALRCGLARARASNDLGGLVADWFAQPLNLREHPAPRHRIEAPSSHPLQDGGCSAKIDTAYS